MTKTIYKIRRNADGLFSSGSVYPRFSEKGKTWSSRGAVTSHLALFDDRGKAKHYTGCVVVAYRVVEEEDNTVDVLEWRPADSTVRAKELQEQRRLEWEKEKRQREIAELERKLKNLKSK